MPPTNVICFKAHCHHSLFALLLQDLPPSMLPLSVSGYFPHRGNHTANIYKRRSCGNGSQVANTTNVITGAGLQHQQVSSLTQFTTKALFKHSWIIVVRLKSDNAGSWKNNFLLAWSPKAMTIRMKKKSVSVQTYISAVSPVFKQEKDLSAEGSPVLWRLAVLRVKFGADRPKVECLDQRRNWEVGICTQRSLVLRQVWPLFQFYKGFSQTSIFW